MESYIHLAEVPTKYIFAKNDTFIQSSFPIPIFETVCNADDLYPESSWCQTSVLRKPYAKHISAYDFVFMARNRV